MRASMGRSQFEQTYSAFASSKPDRPGGCLQQGNCARLDVDSNTPRGAEDAALHRIAEEQTGDPRTEIQRGGHGDQALALRKRLDPEEAEHVADVVRTTRIHPKAQ